METGRNTKRRRVNIVLLILLVVASALLVVGHMSVETPSPELVSLLIEPGADVDGVRASFIDKDYGKVILLSGFIGSPTVYGEPLRLCNVGKRKLTLQLETSDASEGWWKGSVFRVWLVRLDGQRSLLLSLPLLIMGTRIELEPGECARVEVEVLVPAHAVEGETASLTISFTGA